MGVTDQGKIEGVVFSDLDATLLHHDTYDFGPARPALEALRERPIVLVLCSSKTRGEILHWQRALGIDGPFIAENGGGVFLSGDDPCLNRWGKCFPERMGQLPAKRFGTDYETLRRVLTLFRKRTSGRIGGFGDMGPKRIEALTGVSPELAQLAVRRDFDEPFLWEPEPSGVELELAEMFFQSRGLRLTRGGRFWHLMGRSDKGRAVRWLLDEVFVQEGVRPPSLGLGDSRNDLEMLQVVSRGVLVARPDGSHLDGAPEGLFLQPGIGPEGWNRAVLDWIESLQ